MPGPVAIDRPPVVDAVELVPPAPGKNLPPRAFTSPEIFALEQRAIFARSWIHVGDLGDLPAAGDYLTAMIGATPVIVLRDPRSGELRGFLNACRHRGAQLLEGRGSCGKQIQCPYHAWSYGLDGHLIGVPYRDQFDCDLSQLGLVPVRVGSVGPLIFACVDPTAPSLDEWVGELAPAFAQRGAERWQLAYELTYELPVNWKLFVENANEGYHIPVVHDVLTDVLAPDTDVTTLEAHGAFTYVRVKPELVPPPFDPMQTKVRFGHLFPSFIPVLTLTDVTYLRIDPLAHDRMRLFVRCYDDPTYAHLRDFRRAAFERTTAQDIEVVQKTWRGLHAVGLPAGVHASRLEARIGHFERRWATAMARELVDDRQVARSPALAVAPA
ncbi:MAG TPA: aromatic ring-hydroxylating dioxygenase subunit alpha [Kofleriaceae bacterium]|nr:aromatic ring-hydroxylating dioxygenase subunit alpha [Kofleriaceae bacterium]